MRSMTFSLRIRLSRLRFPTAGCLGVLLLPILGTALIACDDAEERAIDSAPLADAATDAAADAGGELDAEVDTVADSALADATVPDAGFDAAPSLGGPDRPALIFAPAGDPPADGWPLLFVLHGYRASPELVRRQFPFDRRIEAHGWVVVYPHGAEGEDGFLFWQSHERVDGVGEDVPYLLALADEVAARHPIDQQRFFVIGHSNGGAMAQSLACFAPGRLAGYANMAGSHVDPDRCPAPAPLTALQICGVDDGAYARVEESAAWWAETVLGCTEAIDAEPVDYTAAGTGAETAIRRWTGCTPGTTAERWRMDGVGHVIIANDGFLDGVHTALTGR